MKKPTVLYPTVVKGIIHAKEMRCESIDGSEIWIKAPESGVITLRNFKPFVHTDGKTYFITHLQKKATYFSLLYKPFIFHHWVGQPPKQDANGNWIPGSEKGNLLLGGYWRTCGWRWQRPDARSNWTPWIWSWGRGPGGHLD